MDHRVEGFPFNIVENPMYDGSTLCFLATSLWYAFDVLPSIFRFDVYFYVIRYEKPAGILITLYVFICYRIALKFEG